MLDGGADPRYLATAHRAHGLGGYRPGRPARHADRQRRAATYERLGSPEGELALGQAVIYLAVAAKSNAGYNAYNAARAFVSKDGSRPVPVHLRNAPTKLMKELGYGKEYRYAHDEPEAYAAGETYLPDGMAEPGWYRADPARAGRQDRRKAGASARAGSQGEKIMDMAQTIALSAGLAWASGLRLYLVVFLAGALSYLGYLHLPSTLDVLQNPLVIGVAGVMAFAELIADKVPAFDSLWDSFQTFIRIPAGALLAAFALGEVDPAWMVAAGLIGGTITAGTHFAKAGSRLAINTSPEPFSNWLASFGEEGMVLAGLWAMLASPLVFLGLLAVFLVIAGFILFKLWGLLGRLLRRV
jgi:uncharacterized membrane protein